jgi:hypothetical protein
MRWREQAAEHAEGRGFAGTIGPEQAEYLTALYCEAHVIDCSERAELAHQIIDLDNQLVAIG